MAAPRNWRADLHRANFPDHPGPGNLDERAIGGADKMRVRAEIPHCAVIDDIGAAVRAKPDIGWAVEPVDVGHECLVACAVASKVLELQCEG